MAPGLANARPPGSAKFANAPPPGLTRRANAPQLPRGGWAHLKLTDALSAFHIFQRLCAEKHAQTPEWRYHIISTKENVTSYTLWDDTLIIFSNDNRGLPRSGAGRIKVAQHLSALVRRFQLAPPWYKTYHAGGRGWRDAFVWRLFAYGKWWKLLKWKDVKNKEFLHGTDWYPTLINLVGED